MTDNDRSALIETADAIFDLTTRITRARQRSRRTLLPELTELQVLTLDRLAGPGSMPLTELREEVGVLPAQMTRILQSMMSTEAGSYIVCCPNDDDRRRTDVEITALGRRVYNTYRKADREMLLQVLEPLGDRDRRDLARVVDRIGENLAETLNRSRPDTNDQRP